MAADSIEQSLAEAHRQLEQLLESGEPDDCQRDRIYLALAALSLTNETWRDTAESVLREVGAKRSRELLGQLALALSKSPEFIEWTSPDEVTSTAYAAGIILGRTPIEGADRAPTS